MMKVFGIKVFGIDVGGAAASFASELRALSCVTSKTKTKPIQANAHLLRLPEELQMYIARYVLEVSLPAAVHFSALTKELRETLAPIHKETLERRLEWLPDYTLRHTISNEGRTLTKVMSNGHECSVAAGPLLPTSGRSAWKVRIDVGEGEAANEGERSNMFIGVCDKEGRNEWGLDLCESVCNHVRRTSSRNTLKPAPCPALLCRALTIRTPTFSTRACAASSAATTRGRSSHLLRAASSTCGTSAVRP